MYQWQQGWKSTGRHLGEIKEKSYFTCCNLPRLPWSQKDEWMVSLTHLFISSSGSWSCRRKATWTSWSRSGGLAPAAATSTATPAPTPTAALSSCTASLASSASWPLACCWPAWWPGWRLGGTATAAARSSPKRWPSTGPGGRASGGKTLPHSTLRIQPQTRAPT